MRGHLLERVEANPLPQLLDGKTLFGAMVVGVVLGLVGSFVGGLVGGLSDPLAVVGLFAPTVLGVVVPAVVLWRTTYEFYADRVEGLPYSSDSVPYEEVAFAVRTARPPKPYFGAADFELVRDEGENVTLENVARPDRVEEILDERLPSPTEWLEANGDPKDEQSATRTYVWWLWWHHHDPELEDEWCEDDLPDWCDDEPPVSEPGEPPAETVGDDPSAVSDEEAFADVTGVEPETADFDDLESELLDATEESESGDDGGGFSDDEDGFGDDEGGFSDDGGGFGGDAGGDI